MPTPKFITLTDTDGNKDRVNADHITWYTANNKGGSRVLLIDHDSANYYAETPEQIDALIAGRKADRRQQRKQTKRALLVELASRPEGVTLEEMLDAVGWKECRGTLGEACRESGLGLECRDGRYYAVKQEAA
ncbi:hypothetical protein J2847_004094 [Azospirillum agricola]|uniref:DUF3489 domain-containing protein n=1 Tax=Azospirillum agricola TaxID=1720247 RepID=UPI001AE84D42|nr:DUF3489 domain-containing protein [Azospirillum agricola]MBP2230785.1 hypothetical protein [Azospirillum agricola]